MTTEKECGHGGRTLLPHGGNWVSSEVGDISDRYFYCFVCQDVIKVKRKNISKERVGNLTE